MGSFSYSFADDRLYTDCLETVKDKEKCTELLKKTKESYEDKKLASTQDFGSSILLRQNIKDSLQSKNKLYVINYLGEPDERLKNGPDYDLFVYKRPVSRRTKTSDPDREITIVFRRELVTEVVHLPPSNESKSQLHFHEATKHHK